MVRWKLNIAEEAAFGELEEGCLYVWGGGGVVCRHLHVHTLLQAEQIVVVV